MLPLSGYDTGVHVILQESDTKHQKSVNMSRTDATAASSNRKGVIFEKGGLITFLIRLKVSPSPMTNKVLAAVEKIRTGAER